MPQAPAIDAPPAPPTGQPVKISQLGSRGHVTEMPPELLAKAKEMAGEVPETSVPSPTPPPASSASPAPASVPAPAKPKAAAQAPAPATPEPHKKTGIEELRAAHETALKKLSELEATDSATKKQLAEAQGFLDKSLKSIAKYEDEIEKSYKPQVQRLSEVEKRLQEREESLRMRDYTATTEWHEKFVRPLVEVRAEAEALMNELTVNDGETERAATKDDFNAVLGARTLNEAARLARQMFGDDVYQSVVQLRNRVLSKERERQGALKTAAEESQKWQEEQLSKAAENRAALRAKLKAESERLAAAEPDVFAPPEDDKELAEALSEGMRLADNAMEPARGQTVDEFVGVVAKARTSIAKAHVMDKKVKRLTAENESLKQRLSAYERSEPGVETRNGGAVPAPISSEDQTHKALLDAAMKLAGGNV